MSVNRNEVKIELSRAVQSNGVDVAELIMREPLVRDQLAAQQTSKNAAEAEVILFANLCDVAPDVIKDLPLADYRKVQGAFENFTD